MPLVLVVEDDRDLRDLLHAMLQLEGLEVEVAADGQRARDWITNHQPDLVLLDWMLPDMDGEAVAAHIRSAHGDAVPIVLFTADGNASEKAARIGAYATIAKPFSLEELTAVVLRATGE